MSETLNDIRIAQNSTEVINQTPPYLIQPKTVPVLVSVKNNIKSGYEVQIGETFVIDEDVTVFIANKSFSTAMVGMMQLNSATPPVVPADAVYLSSVGLAIVGSINPPLTFTTNPTNASGYSTAFYSTDSTGVRINADNTWTVLTDASGVSIAVTLTNLDGSTVSDSSGVHTSTLSAYSDSTSAVSVGGTFQLTYTISPDEVATHPELQIEFFSNDTTIATIDSTGLAKGIAEGDTRIGVKATFRGAISSDSSYFQVNA